LISSFSCFCVFGFSGASSFDFDFGIDVISTTAAGPPSTTSLATALTRLLLDDGLKPCGDGKILPSLEVSFPIYVSIKNNYIHHCEKIFTIIIINYLALLDLIMMLIIEYFFPKFISIFSFNLYNQYRHLRLNVTAVNSSCGIESTL
jgi:hypothetical protein